MPITESEIRVAAIRELATTRSGRLTTTELIERLTDTMKPVGHDMDILEGRSDTVFSQKVRNLVSHRNQASGLQGQDLANYDADTESWTITNAGRAAASNPYAIT